MNDQPGQRPNKQGLIEWMANNSVAANLVMIILFGGGLWAAFAIQKEVFPQYELDMVEASVTYPGASPEEVEQGILLPIEEAVKSVQGIKEMTSTAREGWGMVLFELVSGTDRMKGYQDIDQAINRIRTFPDDTEKPEVRLYSRQREVMDVGLFGGSDIWVLRKLAERLRDRLLSDPRITQVVIDRVPDYVTHVEISLHRLREYNLTLGAVARIIEQSSQDIPAGAIETKSGEIILRFKERKLWAQEFGSIIVSSTAGGVPVTLADLAHVEDGFEESGFHSQYNRQLSVELEVYRVGTQSPLDIAKAVEEILADFKTSLPPGIHIRIDRNRAKDYGDRLALLQRNAVYAIVIVLLILAVFLEYRLAFWVMMGMAVSFFGGLMILPALGVSINMTSMFAFLVALGIVVDDAIIIGENIFEYRQQGLSLFKAAVHGTRDIAGPVVFSVMTNIVAFVPLMFMPGTTGKFWWPIPVVVITVLVISLVEALFILPAHLAHSEPRGQNVYRSSGSSLATTFFRPFPRLGQALLRCLPSRCAAKSVHHPHDRHRTIAGRWRLWLQRPHGHDHDACLISRRNRSWRAASGWHDADQAAKVARAVTESTHRMFQKHNLDRVAEGIKTNVRGQRFIDVEIVMKPPDEHDWTAADIIQLWRAEIGDIEGVDQITFEAESGPQGYRDDIMIDLSHADIDVLARASQELVERAKEFQLTRDVNDNYDKGKLQYDFQLRPEARSLGLTAEEVGRQLRHAFFGAVAKRTLRGTNEIEVRVKLPKAQRKELQSLQDFVILAPDGTQVPLMDVAYVEEGEAFNSITRRNGRRVVTVGMDVEPKRMMSSVRDALQSDVLPQLRSDYPGITWTFQGMHAEMGRSTKALWGGFAMAMAVIYALLAIAFGSYLQPLIVMTAIPFGIVGAVIGHILLGFDLSLISLMGVIALSGVVVNDSLIMVHHANKLRPDLSARRAIHKAGIRRFRPIVLTTLTTFGGLTPIILETSRQAYYLIPMAISLGFGIIFATSIILVFVPCLYLIVDDVVSLTTKRTTPVDVVYQ